MNTSLLRSALCCALCSAALMFIPACTPLLSPEVQGIVDTTWVFDSYNQANNSQLYSPASPSRQALQQGGFTMKSSGEFINYANAGWCGTPPISYAEFKGGKWTKVNDSTFTIEAAYWGTLFIAGQPPSFSKYTMTILRHATDRLEVQMQY